MTINHNTCARALLCLTVILAAPGRGDAAEQRCDEVRIVNREPINVRIDETSLRASRDIDSIKTPVDVASSRARPLWVRSADEADRQVFQWTGEAQWTPGQIEARLELTMPAGRRFYLQSVSAYARLPRGQTSPLLMLATVAEQRLATHYVPFSRAVGGVGPQGALEQLTVYQVTSGLIADGQSRLAIVVPRSSSEGEGRVWVTLAGYLQSEGRPPGY